ncbi:MAG: TlpA family protein disulfide reductase [Verrucomicrobiota bacterium]|nr:TlpA family protein disulfide reductase [Verrucomicrobiota bacterium]
MKSSRPFATLFIVLAVAAAAGWYYRNHDKLWGAAPVASSPPAASDARLAPSWKLRDVDGKTVDSAQFKGKVVVLDFWATWCPPCRSEIPGYIKLQEKYRGKGLAVVGVSLDQQGPEVVKKFMAEQHMNYTVVMGDEAVTRAFGGIDAIPTTFIIDRSGNIRHKKVGAMETADFEKMLAPYLD